MTPTPLSLRLFRRALTASLGGAALALGALASPAAALDFTFTSSGSFQYAVSFSTPWPSDHADHPDGEQLSFGGRLAWPL